MKKTILFGGSGSECEVCKEGGRNYISAELQETYHDLIIKRLKEGEIPKEYYHKSRLPRKKKEAVEDEKQAKVWAADFWRGHLDEDGKRGSCTRYGTSMGGFHHLSQDIIIATESGMLHRLAKEVPDKNFIPAPTHNCACAECHFMKMNTLEKVRNCMRDLTPQVELTPEIIERSRLPIERMLEWTAR